MPARTGSGNGPCHDGEEAPQPSLQARLHASASFLPKLTQPGFTPGHLIPPQQKDGVFDFGSYVFSPEMDSFISVAYEMGWVLRRFRWVDWIGTDEAKGLRDRRDALSKASADQLAKLLTVVIRQERLCTGATAAAFDSGLLADILRRAAVLEIEHRQTS